MRIAYQAIAKDTSLHHGRGDLQKQHDADECAWPEHALGPSALVPPERRSGTGLGSRPIFERIAYATKPVM